MYQVHTLYSTHRGSRGGRFARPAGRSVSALLPVRRGLRPKPRQPVRQNSVHDERSEHGQIKQGHLGVDVKVNLTPPCILCIENC